MARQVGRRSGEAKAAVIARRIRKEQLRGCAGRVSVAHVREQKKFNPWAGKPWGSRRSQHSEPIRLHHLVPGVHDVQQFLPLIDRSTDHRHPRNLITVEYFSSPILFIAGVHFPSVLIHNQGYPKVCPDSLNLPNADDPFAGISSLSSCSLFFPNQGLNCFDLESSRVFSIRFPKLSLFQISEHLQVLYCALELKVLLYDLG
jgi:hypothetical protein